MLLIIRVINFYKLLKFAKVYGAIKPFKTFRTALLLMIT